MTMSSNNLGAFQRIIGHLRSEVEDMIVATSSGSQAFLDSHAKCGELEYRELRKVVSPRNGSVLCQMITLLKVS